MIVLQHTIFVTGKEGRGCIFVYITICLLCCVVYHLVSHTTLHNTTRERRTMTHNLFPPHCHHYHYHSLRSFSAILSHQYFTGKSSTLSQPYYGRPRIVQPPATIAYYFISIICILLHLTSHPNCFSLTKFSSKGDHGKIIALLDIFGFESFEVRACVRM